MTFLKKIKLSALIPIGFILLVIIYTYPLIGLWGQIKPASYPESFEDTNAYLKSQNITGHIIYLPWQTYLTYNWTRHISADGRIANPINKVVEPLVITGPDEYGGYTELQKSITSCLNQTSITCLESLDVQYILTDKCSSYNDYAWIGSLGLDKDHEDSCIVSYKISNSHTIDRKIKIPMRFYIGSAISAITLGVLVYLLASNKPGKRVSHPK